MRRFMFNISVENDIFSADERQAVADLLVAAARQVVLHDDSQGRPVQEANGNTVGEWKFVGRRGA